MKSYTDVEQSKKLAEILPLKSADAWWAERYAGQVMSDGQYIVNKNPVYYLSLTKPSNDNYSQDTVKDIPCWSLTALLEELNRNCWKVSLKCCGAEWDISYDDGERYISVSADYAIDACYEMIIRLHEQNLL